MTAEKRSAAFWLCFEDLGRSTSSFEASVLENPSQIRSSPGHVLAIAAVACHATEGFALNDKSDLATTAAASSNGYLLQKKN